MVQRKKEGVRDAILEAAFRLFSEQGYSETSIPGIAREAGMSTANVYVYFQSKIDILFQLYSPWLLGRLDKLERAQRRIADPQERLRKLLLTLWRDLPRENNGFTNNVMQAVSTSGNGDYSPALRQLFQSRVAGWIRECLATSAEESDMLASLALMAFDGFAMNVRLAHSPPCNDDMAQLFSRLFAGAAAKSASTP
ncbi:TetR/AcrR family transcriptional regulator [Variovorax saccharolyticus]|uniref:TetR/AcrR family transcriptional regulator n=1 Tax=Variovorax saccharolyticus TaxID=3053516 RepID=UPI0025776A89|nr:TetR/AcrR family transcriptional regulator [Variovorax sp. J31P216]MDM0025285.1 TetR/AcrR family transcriptional regulator [Variovorax sp. J31P216]